MGSCEHERGAKDDPGTYNGTGGRADRGWQRANGDEHACGDGGRRGTGTVEGPIMSVADGGADIESW